MTRIHRRKRLEGKCWFLYDKDGRFYVQSYDIDTGKPDPWGEWSTLQEATWDFDKKTSITIWCYIREYSESVELPEVNLFTSEDKARAAMIAEVFTLRETTGNAWVTEYMDEEAVERDDVTPDCTSLNLQWHGGAVDCFRLYDKKVQ